MENRQYQKIIDQYSVRTRLNVCVLDVWCEWVSSVADNSTDQSLSYNVSS